MQQIEAALEAIGLQTLADIPVPTPLCKQHYHQVYNLLQPTQTNCLNCGMSLRHASPSPRPCPNPVMIEKYLQDNTGFEGNVRAQDKVCFPCYKSFLVILLEHKPTSTDDDLQMLISTYSQQIPTTDDITTVNDVLDVAMIKTTVFIGEQLLSNHAILLPTVHDFFMSDIEELRAGRKIETEVKSISARWILSNLTANLQQHISNCCSCPTRKHGTLLFRPN